MNIDNLLSEIETTAAEILDNPDVQKPLDENGTVERALELAQKMRCALQDKDPRAAADVGVSLGELLLAFRKLGNVVRLDASYVSPVNRAHSVAFERRKAFQAWRDRGFSTSAAYEKAAEQMGVSPKTIVRAVRGH
jgi:hypothetical protein